MLADDNRRQQQMGDMSRENSQQDAEDYEFWAAVDQHRQGLIQDAKITAVRNAFQSELNGMGSKSMVGSSQHGSTSHRHTLMKIESTVKSVLETAGSKGGPVLSYDNTRLWENITFDDTSGLQMVQDARKTQVKFDSPQSTKKFTLMVKVLSIIYKLVQANTYCTKRDIYYQDTVLFGSQSVVDNIVDCVSCMLKIPRWELHILATSKGCIAGDFRFHDNDGDYFECSSTSSMLIPSHVNGITNMDTRAKFILVVEKDATFQKLMDDGFCRRMRPCIIMTGKGFPDVNSRLLLRKIWTEFQIPIFALVDADPHGMEIMAVYRFGSLALAFESHHLTVPAVRWLGVFPSDISRFKIPESVLIPLAKADINKAKDLLNRPYVVCNQIWSSELQTLLSTNVKAEIQSLAAISPRFLSDVYIPGKLQQGGWI